MERENNFIWCRLLCLALFIYQSACQTCSEFISPMTISTIGTSVGTIQVPRDAARLKYNSNQICEWNIVTSISDFGIRLDVKRSDLQGRNINKECNNDYVDIFDFLKGDIVFMDRFCGSESGKSYLTTGNKMTVRFYSDLTQEFSGFQAMYQPVPAGPSKDQQDEENKRNLDMAIGIPVGILTLAVVIIATVFIIRYCRRKKAARQPNTTALTQNPSASRRSFPVEYHPSDTSGNMQPPDYTQDHRAGTSQFFHRNDPLHVIMFERSPDGFGNNRSITPPPAYDSLDFISGDIENSAMPLTPPPYEVIAKQHMWPPNE